MKIVFVSNYYNHHQAPLSEAFDRKMNGDYYFIQTIPMDEERASMGWGETLPQFVVKSYQNEETYKKALRLIDEADVVIVGSAPQRMITGRIRQGKLVFRYSERIYKNKKKLLTLPLRFVKYHLDNFPSRNVYLLCASAYAAADYAKTGMYRGKAFKWGYFPPTISYENIDSLIHSKKPGSILWCARFLNWKHPEVAISVAEYLRKISYPFEMNLIGTGVMQNEIRRLIDEKGLSSCVHLLGAMSPQEVRKHMEESRIFLFTSDFNEGWGAVLNEAMNSGCAVVASHAIGASSYLIKDKENGFIYRNGNQEEINRKVKYLLDNPQIQAKMGKQAYETIIQEWNADVAAERFIALVNSINKGELNNISFQGVCEKEK